MPGTGSLDSTPVVGVLGKSQGKDRTISYAGRGTGVIYHYGYPTYGTAEASVAAQWLFDEAAGNIVDEVASITLVPGGSAVPRPKYSSALGGSWSGVSPGCIFEDDAGTQSRGIYFYANASVAAMDHLQADGVIEWIGVLDVVDENVTYVFATRRTALDKGIYIRGRFIAGSFKTITMDIVCEDATNVSKIWTTTNYMNDGLPHKYRVTLDRSGNAELFIDGISQGTGDISGTNGKDIKANDCVIAGAAALTEAWHGKLYEFRWTVGNLTNNSGGPGGG